MKTMNRTITFILTATAITACASMNAEAPTEPKAMESSKAEQRNEETEAQLAKAQSEATLAKQEYVYAQKSEFIGKMKKELADIQSELDALTAKADRSRDAAKADAKLRIKATRAKWTQAKNRLDQVEASMESTWENLQNGFKQSYGELTDSVNNTRLWLSEKIAP